MKYTLLLSALLSLTSFAYGQTCKVDLSNNNRVIRSFYANLDYNGRCRDAMRECSKYKRLNNYNNARCAEVNNNGGGHTGGNTGGHTGGGHQNTHFRVGDLVFPATWNSSRGGTILSVNNRRDELRVKSNTTFNVYTLRFDEVAVANGCLGPKVCVGDNVLLGNWNSSRGAEILGINYFTNQVFVKSLTTFNTYFFNKEDLYLTTGCMYGYCVGQRVYPRSWNSSRGGEIVGISRSKRSYIVKSNTTHNIYVMSQNDF